MEKLSASFKTYAGLFFTTLATLMYELLLVRVFSVTMYYHFAFVAISVAMFGMTCGALTVYLFPSYFSQERVKLCLALSSVGFSVAIVLSLFTHLAIPYRTDLSLFTVCGITLNYFILSVPFMMSGIVVCLGLTRFSEQLSFLYAVDLAGAAFACYLVVLVMKIADAPSAVVASGVLAGVGAIFFSSDSRNSRIQKIALVASLVMAVLVTVNVYMAHLGRPPLRLVWVKGSFEEMPLYMKWNSFARISVKGNDALTAPFGWGLSDEYKGKHKVGQLEMRIDANAGTVLTKFDGNLSTLDYLKYDITNIGHHLRQDKNVLVVGVGGGRDILAALCFGQKSVLGVEINEDILYAINERFGSFTGHLDKIPGVKFVNDEARSYIARSEDRYDIIQVSLIDSWAATAAGAFVLAENSLYTVEAWRVFLKHLTGDGFLTFSRWYFPRNPTEIYRLTSLASASLLASGSSNPRDHIVLIGKTGKGVNPGVATILVFKEPLTTRDVDSVEELANRLKFQVLLSPKASADETFVNITSAKDAQLFTKNFTVNIEAPTDDTPFFFNMLRARDMFNPLYWSSSAVTSIGTLSFNTRAVAVLGILILVVVFLTGICIVGPLALTTERSALRGTAPLMLFFSAIGVGFMMIEISQMQRLIIFLGHPVYGLSVILFSLLLFSGLGSWCTDKVDPNSESLAPAIMAAALLIILIVFGLINAHAVNFFETSSVAVRMVVATAMLFPVGFFMGTAFPLGMKLAIRRTPTVAPWLWGINGATSVVASVSAVAIALAWGISTVFWVGFFFYVVAVIALFWMIIANVKNYVR